MEITPLQPERRSSSRHRVALPVRFDEGGGITRDLSADGVYFLTDQPLELGQVVHLSMTLHHADPERPVDLVCRGRVCRIEAIEGGPDGGLKRGVAVIADDLAFTSGTGAADDALHGRAVETQWKLEER